MRLCDPKNAGGLAVIDLKVWNIAIFAKLLWNLCNKSDKLWIRWVHVYYMKQGEFADYQIKESSPAILKKLEKCKGVVEGTRTWSMVCLNEKFSTKMLYKELRMEKENIAWRKVFYNNDARPRAKFIMWLACLNRLYTKDRLLKFGLCRDSCCYMCDKEENVEHLFFECGFAREVWNRVLVWLGFDHHPKSWLEEIDWVQKAAKTSRGRVLKAAMTEVVYFIWKMRNRKRCEGAKENIDE